MKPSEQIKGRAKEIDKDMSLWDCIMSSTDYDESQQKALILAILEYLDSLPSK